MDDMHNKGKGKRGSLRHAKEGKSADDGGFEDAQRSRCGGQGSAKGTTGKDKDDPPPLAIGNKRLTQGGLLEHGEHPAEEHQAKAGKKKTGLIEDGKPF